MIGLVASHMFSGLAIELQFYAFLYVFVLKVIQGKRLIKKIVAGSGGACL